MKRKSNLWISIDPNTGHTISRNADSIGEAIISNNVVTVTTTLNLRGMWAISIDEDGSLTPKRITQDTLDRQQKAIETLRRAVRSTPETMTVDEELALMRYRINEAIIILQGT